MADQQTFTSSLRRLEEIVAKLEQPDLELEQGIALLEEGIALHRYCQEKLDQTQIKVTQLLNEPVTSQDTEPSKKKVERQTADLPVDPWSKPSTEDTPRSGTLFDNEDDGLP
jgi:exodeoxyribonuclease VII small subunit